MKSSICKETRNDITVASSIVINAMLLTDGYKLGHKNMYPEGMTKLYSNFTPRSNNYFPAAENGTVVFGIQYFIKKYLVDEFNVNFFNRPVEDVVAEYAELLEDFLGADVAKSIGTDHIRALHELGHLPIRIKALPEGIYCPIGVPVLTITNTDSRFAWLTNYLETLLSTALWKPMVNATTSDVFKRELVRHAHKTGFLDVNDMSNINFLCHDFSMRGMSGTADAAISGMAHLVSFSGSETVPAIIAARYYYNASKNVAGTIPATEHSVECSNATDFEGNPDDEIYFKNMLERFPDGFISVVADGYDYWKFVGEIVPKYKKEILNRNGRVVIRPDSGDPVKIICGDPSSDDPIVRMGTYELLFTIFGGEINDKGYKVLDPHIGLIYGDSINMKRQKEIYKQLEEKGFAATNLVLGIGSFSMNLSTRDSLGFAMKATYCEIDGRGKEIFKSPKTSDGGMPKKSLRGLIAVVRTYPDNKLIALDRVDPEAEASENIFLEPFDIAPYGYASATGMNIQVSEFMLKTVFEDGKIVHETTFDEVRERHNKAMLDSMAFLKGDE